MTLASVTSASTLISSRGPPSTTGCVRSCSWPTADAIPWCRPVCSSGSCRPDCPASTRPSPGSGRPRCGSSPRWDSFAGSRAPARIAERLGLSEKTVRTHAAALLGDTPPLVHSDREVWTLYAGACSDVDWLHDLATTARTEPDQHHRVLLVNECCDLLERVTGPGAESKQWVWVHDREEGPSPAENATRLRLLVEAVVIVGEVWPTVADDPTVRPAAQLVQTLLRLEQALRTVEPWELFTVATDIARHAPDSARQQIALRLAQLAHNGNVDVPEQLVAAVVG